jgi:hypothetical protein
MHQNRELTGNFKAKLLIPLELNDVFAIRESTEFADDKRLTAVISSARRSQ